MPKKEIIGINASTKMSLICALLSAFCAEFINKKRQKAIAAATETAAAAVLRLFIICQASPRLP
jgi:hypothetical protein